MIAPALVLAALLDTAPAAASPPAALTAADALFAAARLAFDRHDRRAEALLKVYLQRFPSGAHSADANELLVRLKGDTQ